MSCSSKQSRQTFLYIYSHFCLDLGYLCLDYVWKPTINSEEEEDVETVRFNFHIESLGLVLKNGNTTKVSDMIDTRRGVIGSECGPANSLSLIIAPASCRHLAPS